MGKILRKYFQGCSTTRPDWKNVNSKSQNMENRTGLEATIATTRPNQTERN